MQSIIAQMIEGMSQGRRTGFTQADPEHFRLGLPAGVGTTDTLFNFVA